MSLSGCQHCGADLTGRQRTTCADCRNGKRRGVKQASGYARMTIDQREDRAEKRKAVRAAKVRIPIGVDGEGHDGRYFLLAAAAEDGSSWQTWKTEGLTSRDCFLFLTGLPVEYTKWGFSFGYDINMMLGNVPFETPLRLYETGWVRYQDFRIQWLPGKMFQVTRYDWDRVLRRQGNKRLGSCTIWDYFPWQASSFVKWLRSSELATPEEIDRIEGMKQRRSDFDPESEREEITAYCLEECRLLAKGAKRLHEMLEDQGVRVHTFHSPATVSKYLMRQNKVNHHMAPPPEELAPLFEAARFGGRAELIEAGPVEGPLFQYDIRSAYPTAMLNLPCWTHGRWERGGTEVTPLSLLRVRWAPLRADPHPLWGPFPVRPRTGSLKWPTRGEGWFWGSEVEGVRLLSSVKVLERWHWVQECDHSPFAYLKDLYEERLTLKAAGDRREYINKIALNASYGATAERRKRGARFEPRWRNLAWAGMITAETRGAVGRQLGPSVVMVATDAVISRAPLDVRIGAGLGEWEAGDYERGVFVGPGVYFLWSGDRWVASKTRGISAADISPEKVTEEWALNGRNGSYRYSRQRFIGLGTALHRVEGLPPPTDGETIWRKFVDSNVVRNLSLEPRREWLSDDPWDGSSRAPSAATVKRKDVGDYLTRMRLREMIVRCDDPITRIRLTEQYVATSTDEVGRERSIFADWDMP